MDLTFVSTNGGKFEEVRSILSEYGVRVRWDRRALTEVQADDLAVVVKSKLAEAARLHPRVLVEDSGLFLSSLGGFPGVYSAYVLDTIGLSGILRLLRERPRGATFRTVAGLALGNRRWILEGVCSGSIAPRARGRNGFGFDPIFIPRGEQRTFGQLSTLEKNRRSHRARAIRRVGRLLETLG